jgi:hypothetical protein
MNSNETMSQVETNKAVIQQYFEAYQMRILQVLTPSQEMEPLPKTWQKAMEHTGQLMSSIKTYDQPTHEIKVEGTSIKVKI